MEVWEGINASPTARPVKEDVPSAAREPPCGRATLWRAVLSTHPLGIARRWSDSMDRRIDNHKKTNTQHGAGDFTAREAGIRSEPLRGERGWVLGRSPGFILWNRTRRSGPA